VMTRRGRFRHRVSHIRAEEPLVLPLQEEIVLVLVRGAHATFRTPQVTADVVSGDTVWLGNSEAPSVEVIPKGALELHVVDIWATDLPMRAIG
jgi:environmental stress-induced protein Ves